jgi:hypothetical protein
MKKIITIVLIVLSINTFAQTLKTYTGNYPITSIFVGQNGTATYKYYDDPENYTRVKSGLFTFNMKGTGDYSFVQMIVTGNYKNNLKNGTWIVKLIYTDFYSDGKYLNGSDVTTANYTDGLLNGAFSYVSTSTTRKKVYNSAKRAFEFGLPTLPKVEKIVAKFRKDNDKIEPNKTGNVLVGNFVYNISDPNINSSFSVNAKLDSLGFFIGKYTINDTQTEKILEFTNGSILTRTINRNLQSGEAKVIKQADDYETDINNKFLLFSKNSPDSLKALNDSYSLRYRTLSAAFNDNSLDFGYFKIKKILEESLFCEDFKGDVNYSGYRKYDFDGFRYRQIDKK